jgi:hypothetical protein
MAGFKFFALLRNGLCLVLFVFYESPCEFFVGQGKDLYG